jgi:predicted DNA-binding transcriptional regulator YafY
MNGPSITAPVPDDAREAVRTAIAGRRRLSFRYHGLPRIVNPVRLGLSARGRWQLRAVQVGGDSETGRFGGRAPKLFAIDEMEDVMVMDAEFHVPRQYQRGDDAFVRIDAEL